MYYYNANFSSTVATNLICVHRLKERPALPVLTQLGDDFQYCLYSIARLQLNVSNNNDCRKVLLRANILARLFSTILAAMTVCMHLNVSVQFLTVATTGEMWTASSWLPLTLSETCHLKQHYQVMLAENFTVTLSSQWWTKTSRTTLRHTIGKQIILWFQALNRIPPTTTKLKHVEIFMPKNSTVTKFCHLALGGPSGNYARWRTSDNNNNMFIRRITA